jgi:YVTN family beta-propeller protein
MFCDLMEFARVLRMTWRRTALALLVVSVLIECGCGDYFRPVAIPLPGPNPDPKSFHFAIVVGQNAAGNPGSATQIDVSGDSAVGAVAPGVAPVHAILLPPSGSRVYVANGTSDTVSTFTPTNPFAFIGAVTTISFPTGSDPEYLHTTENTVVYAADSGSNDVAVINATANVITSFIPAGPNPNLLAETPNAQKLYVLNSGNNTITSINPINRTVNGTFAVPGVSTPAWMAASLDSSQLFILDSATGAITALNTMTDTVASTTSNPAGAGANFMLLDRHLNRLYVSNPSSGKVFIYDANAANPTTATPPAFIASVTLPPGTQTPASGRNMITALNDGTRVYVASYQPATACAGASASDQCVSWQVTVIRTSDNTVQTTIPLGPVDLTATGLSASQPTCAGVRFPVSITSSVDSSRVYVANCFAGTTSIINTGNEQFVLNMNAPVSAYPAPPQPANPPPTPVPPPPQNPVWVVAGP